MIEAVSPDTEKSIPERKGRKRKVLNVEYVKNSSSENLMWKISTSETFGTPS